MSHTYCGKNCEYCGHLSRGECGGCDAVWRECEIANCCWSKGHRDCTTCSFQSSCLKLNKKDRAPENRAQAREWERKKQEAQAAREAELARRAPVLGKWLWVLFWLVVPIEIANILTHENVVEMFPSVYFPGQILEVLCTWVYAAGLLRLSSIEERYRFAGWCFVGSAVIETAVFLIFREGMLVLRLILLIAAAVLSLVGEYQEYAAHAHVVADLDYDLSEKWRKLWKWYLLAMGALLLGTLLTVIVIGVLLALAASIAVIVVSILKWVYLYRTAKLFREYPVKQI